MEARHFAACLRRRILGIVGVDLLKESRVNAPVAVADQMFSWLSSAFGLRAAIDDILTVPAELRVFDQSLSGHLELLVKSSADASFARRLMFLERECMQCGKSVPARKLLIMIAHRAIRDPSQEDALSESAFVRLVADGTSVTSLIAFLDNFLELLGKAREGL